MLDALQSVNRVRDTHHVTRYTFSLVRSTPFASRHSARVRRWAFCVILAALGLVSGTGCRSRTAGYYWPYPGFDLANSRFVRPPGPRLKGNWQFSRVWEAEDYLPEAQQLNPVSNSAARRLLVADIDRSPGPEIILSVDGSSAVLDRSGVLCRQSPPGEFNSSVFRAPDRSVSLVACSSNVVRVYPPARSPSAEVRRIHTSVPATEAVLVALPRAPGSEPASPTPSLLVTIEQIRSEPTRDRVPAGITAIKGYDPARDTELWTYETGASVCHVWAVADVNGDTQPEVIIGTYGYEHGISVNGIADSSKAYVLCFSPRGELLWNQSFGDHRYLYTQALVTDLDGDAKSEVVVACGSWDREFGSLMVLDGRTGTRRARFPSDNPLGYAFTGIAAADIDRDGQTELCAVSSGRSARVWILRPAVGHGGLAVVDSSEYSAGITETFVNADILAVADFGGSPLPELLIVLSRETQIDDDPYFCPSRITESHIIVLDAGLADKKVIALSSAPKLSAVANLGRPAVKGVLVVTDRVEYYEPK